MKYKLLNTEGLSAEQIIDLVNKGARFKIFKFQIALVAVSLPRLSPAILIRTPEELKKFTRKYNLITLLAGPWFFPSGPVDVYSTIKFNNKGAIDATQDLLINIKHYDPAAQTIELKKVYTLFDQLPKNDLKVLKKALENYFAAKPEIKKAFVGRYVNVEEHIEPPYFIGIDAGQAKGEFGKEMMEHIYKKFNEYVVFQVFTKHENAELFERITEQGQDLMFKK